MLAELAPEERTEVGLREPLRLRRVGRVVMRSSRLRRAGGRRDDADHEQRQRSDKVPRSRKSFSSRGVPPVVG